MELKTLVSHISQLGSQGTVVALAHAEVATGQGHRLHRRVMLDSRDRPCAVVTQGRQLEPADGLR